MRKLFLVLVLAVSASLGACSTCKLEREAVLQLEKNHEHIFPRYAAYVAKDTSLSAEAKDSEVKLLEATKRTVERLKKRTEE